MTGIYFNGNGKYQSVLEEVMHSTRINTRTKNCLKAKIEEYNKFYVTRKVTDELRRNAIRKYHNIGNLEMAVAAYIEEDIDKFLRRVQIRYKL